MKKIILIKLSLLFVTSLCIAQDNDILSNKSFKADTDDPIRMMDAYHKDQHNKRHYVELARIREADVMWSRKIWREIDLRQKINHPIYYPQAKARGVNTIDRKNLFDVIYHAAITPDEETNKTLRLYEAGDYGEGDEFQGEPMSLDRIEAIMQGEADSIRVENEAGEDSLDLNGDYVYKEARGAGEKNTENIKKWLVKEHWFFDKQRSVMDVRIIGICPVYTVGQEGKRDNEVGVEKQLFWVYFPEARKHLKNALAFNLVKNEAENKTYEDIFMKRMFSSTIIKEGNVMDREISDYMVGLDALLEAERIKEEIFNFEHDLWEY